MELSRTAKDAHMMMKRLKNLVLSSLFLLNRFAQLHLMTICGNLFFYLMKRKPDVPGRQDLLTFPLLPTLIRINVSESTFAGVLRAPLSLCSSVLWRNRTGWTCRTRAKNILSTCVKSARFWATAAAEHNNKPNLPYISP